MAGTDGVTLETYKLVQVLRQAGHQVVFFAGALSEAFQPGQKVPEAHFETSFNRSLESYCFGTVAPLPTLQRQELEAVQGRLERALYEFIADFKIDVLVSENAFSIPMQFPLGLALTNVIEQSQLPAIGHHHDFAWERERFVLRPPEVEEFLARAFPPVHLPQLRHLVINHPAQIELQRRFQVRAIILPNVMEFERLPVPGQAERFRHAIGMPANRKLLLQPTRVVARKGIESTLELAH
ncbi:MAG: glycosyltransferase family 1 protein, partial [Candidatus Dormibacteraceae bacterium]